MSPQPLCECEIPWWFKRIFEKIFKINQNVMGSTLLRIYLLEEEQELPNYLPTYFIAHHYLQLNEQ